MKPLTCAAARRRLHALYDGELSVAEQIAVQGHMDWCDACAAILDELRIVGSALRAGALGRDWLSHEEAAAMTSALVSRRKAEHEASLFARVQAMFDDMHLVYAGVGAAVATAVCLVIVLSMLRFASFGRPDATATSDERPDSLAALLDLVATPASSANAMAIDAASHARWAARAQAANESAEEDAVFALAAIVTRDRRLTNIHPRGTSGLKARREEASLIDALVDEVTRARIEPGATDGTPAAPRNSMVWLVTRTTVRASKSISVDLQLPGVDLQSPAVTKKRTIASLNDPMTAAKA
jgi:Putative zinc-finger